MTRSVPINAGPAAETCRGTVQEGCYGLRPQDLTSAYGLLSTTAPSEQTIALVDAYNDPTAEKDLKVYDEAFDLPACTNANGCFTEVNQSGETGNPPFPRSLKELKAARKGSKAEREQAEEAAGWAGEISLDVEVAHAICEKNCHILLVEAASSRDQDLETAETYAVAAGATEISNSWWTEEPFTDSPAFNDPGTVITAAAGDYGYLNWDVPEDGAAEEVKRGSVDYPASSPHVVAVGGTRLELSSPAGTWSSTVWNGAGPGVGGLGAGGSGCSEHFDAPPWQLELANWSSVGCASKRAVADVSADADPYTGVAVYDTTPDETGQVQDWEKTIGGTSLASPLVAGMFALAGGAGGVEYPAMTLYENESKLYDVVSGSNGECSKPLAAEGRSGCTTPEEAADCATEAKDAICLAGLGYDGPSGLGTPNGIGALEPTGAPVKHTQLIKFTSSAPGSAAVGGAGYAVAATASSGLPVSFSSGTPSVCSVSEATVSFLGLGTCTIDANEEGSSDFDAAPEAQQSFAVGKGTQLIEFTSSAPGSAAVGGAGYAVAATASSGLPVSFSSGTPSVCSVSEATVSFLGLGTCTIDANQEGSSDYDAAPQAQQSFAVGSAPVLTSTPPGPASSSTLSFVSSFTPTPNSSFSLLANPSVDPRTGAITFKASVSDAGTFSWLLSFPNGMFGAFPASRQKCDTGQIKLGRECRAAKILFGKGSMRVGAAGIVSFTIKPSSSALKALEHALKKGKGLPVTAALTFQSSLGGSPASHTQSITDRLRKMSEKRPAAADRGSLVP
jgi:hypothetical protein